MKNTNKRVPAIVKLFDPKMIFHDLVILTGAIPVLLDLRVRRIYAAGKKPRGIFRGKYIISSNHMSLVDPVILSAVFWKRRVGFLATSDFFQNWFWNITFSGFGCISVDKRNPSLKTFKAVEERLDRGHIVCVFPEGEVSQTENMGAFKSGIVMMAVMSKADILPVYLVKRKNRFRRQVAVIGEKIDCMQYSSSPIPTMEDITAVTQMLAQKERELEELWEQKKRY